MNVLQDLQSKLVNKKVIFRDFSKSHLSKKQRSFAKIIAITSDNIYSIDPSCVTYFLHLSNSKVVPLSQLIRVLN